MTEVSLSQGNARGMWVRCSAFLAVVLLVNLLTPTGLEARDDGPSFLVIAHPQVEQTTLERRVVADMFLKKQTRWDDGSSIQPVDLQSGSTVREKFSQEVLRRSVAAVRSYWQQRIFSGRGVPPPEVRSDEEARRFVATHPGSIGYVSYNAEVKGVKIIKVRD